MKKYGSLLILILVAALWGSAFATRKMGMEELEPLFFNGLRFIAGAVFILILIACRKPLRANRTLIVTSENGIKMQVCKGMKIGLAYSIGTIFQQLGLVGASASVSGFLTSTYVLMVPLIYWIVSRRKIGKIMWTCIAFSLLGLFLINYSDTFSITASVALLLIGAFGFALQIIIIDRDSGGADPVFLAFVELATIAIINLAVSLMIETWNSPSEIWNSMPVILYTGIFPLGIAMSLQLSVQKNVDPTLATIALGLESVFSMFFGVILLGESMTLLQFTGAAIIFTAVIVSSVSQQKK